MNFLEFLIHLGWLVSVDFFLGFIIYHGYLYFDNKYNSKLEVNILREENKFLKKENKKINDTSANFWDSKDVKELKR